MSSVKTLYLRKINYVDVLRKYLEDGFVDEQPLRSKPVATVISNTSTVEVAPGVSVNVIRTPIGASNKCYHCHGDIPAEVKTGGGGLGVAYECNKTPSGHEVHSYGYYCRAECELGAAIKKKKNFPNAEKILRSLYAQSGVTAIVPAPHFTTRKLYGGPLDDIEYYKNRHTYIPLPGYTVYRVEVYHQRLLDTAMRDVVIRSSQ